MKIEKTQPLLPVLSLAENMAKIEAEYEARQEARRIQALKDEKDITKPEYWSKLDRLQKRVEMAKKIFEVGGDKPFETKRRLLVHAAIVALHEHVKAGE